MKIYSQQAEEALIGSLFLEPELIQECTLRPEDFYLKRLQLLFAAILRVEEQGKPLDIVSIVDEIGEENLGNVGGLQYITSIATHVPTTANFHYYQASVKEYAKKRQAMQVTGKIQHNLSNGDITDTLRQGIQELIKLEGDLDNTDDGEIASSLIQLYKASELDVGDISGIPSGFRLLDQLTGGFQASDLIIIGARPSMGKTAFALNLALHAAQEHVVMMFSLEMSKQQLLKRAICTLGQINTIKMRNPKRHFTEEDWAKFTDAIANLSTINLQLYDKGGIDVNYIWSRIRKVQREMRANTKMLVIIDYLQLIMGNPKHRGNRLAEISEISRMLKTLAREENVVVLALSQLSRGVESRQDKRPLLSDLRESGQIEQDADVIAFLYREDYYNKEMANENIVELVVAKQRNGPIGTIRLGFEKEVGRFWEVMGKK